MKRAAWLASCVLLFSGCNDDGPKITPLPTFFQLNGVAAIQEGEFSVECSLEFIVEISGEVSRTSDVIEYVGTMGGEAVRVIQREDGSGVVLSAFAFYPNLQVLHIFPDRVQIVSLDFPPDGPSTGSRFWDELRFFDGTIDRDGVITGEWLCAPLDVEQGGINDDSVFADGIFETVTLAQQ